MDQRSTGSSSSRGSGPSRRGRSRGLADIVQNINQLDTGTVSSVASSVAASDTESVAASDTESVAESHSDSESQMAKASGSSDGSPTGSTLSGGTSGSVDELTSAASSMSVSSSSVSSSVAVEAAPAIGVACGPGEKGKVGMPQDVVTNYFRMNKTADFTLYGYRVDFTPEEDETKNKRALMRIHEDKLGHFMFDGHTLYSGKIFPDELRSLQSANHVNGEQYQIKLRLVSEIEPGNKLYLQFYNIALRCIMEKIGLEQVGRHYYNRHKEIKMNTYQLVLWPGFITAVRDHEEGMLLCAEVTHKVLRAETAFDVMGGIAREAEARRRNVNEAMKEGLLDSIVITHYNRRTYRIDDIDFELTPQSTFELEDGTQMSYVDYYKKKWNIDFTNHSLQQPMLISIPRRKDINKGVKNNIYLIPSLCHMTGLTDNMRKNYTLMKDLSVHLHMSPQERKKKLDEFISEFAKPEIKAEFEKWHFEFSTDFVPAKARVFNRENVRMINSTGQEQWLEPDRSSDWTVHFKNAGLLEPVTIKKWIIFAPKDLNRGQVEGLSRTMKDVGRKLGVMLDKEINIVEYDGRRPFDKNGFMNGVKQSRDGLELVFFILPNNALPRYAAVKKACTLDLKSVSQCFLSKHLRPDAKNLNSICQKMLIQINAKMRGEPWAVKIPLPKLMVLGFDVYHCPDRKGESVGALVGTTNKNCTKYYSTVSFHKDKGELSANMSCDILKCLEAYFKLNNDLPTRIILFRDGVGEGQIEYVIQNEVRQVEDGIHRFYTKHGHAENIRLAFIIVTKKINTRYLVQERGKWISPIPGTVLDTTVTLPERYDFFLVSQTVRQGTVSPTNYHIVKDTSGLDADKLQQLTYKLCHLYFNWSGTVAVPAPCQYAHKLAYLTGMALADVAPSNLANNLWYL